MIEKLLNTFDEMHWLEKTAIVCSALFFTVANASMFWMLIY